MSSIKKTLLIMKHLAITIYLSFCFSIYSVAQINVSIDNNCLKHNFAIISKAIIEKFGKDSVKHLLNNKTNISFVCGVDSFGYIKKIERIWSKQEVSDKFIVSIENYLISNKIPFYLFTFVI